MKRFFFLVLGLLFSVLACAENNPHPAKSKEKAAPANVAKIKIPAAQTTPCADPSKQDPIPAPTKEFSLFDKKDTGCKLK